MDGDLRLHIEQARRSDLNEIMRVENLSFGIEAFPREEFVWLRRLGRETFLVARRESRLVGYIAAFMEEGSGYIASMAVDPQHRRQGVGAALMTAVIERLTAKGTKSMTLHVREANETAVRLYERQGFTVEARVLGYYEDGAPALYMRLRL